MYVVGDISLLDEAESKAHTWAFIKPGVSRDRLLKLESTRAR